MKSTLHFCVYSDGSKDSLEALVTFPSLLARERDGKTRGPGNKAGFTDKMSQRITLKNIYFHSIKISNVPSTILFLLTKYKYMYK